MSGDVAAAPAAPTEVLLDVKGVSAGYGQVLALEDVSLQVRRGEAVGILGANGAGKTTLMRVIAGELGHASGDLLYGGDRKRARQPAWGRVRDGIILTAEGHRIIGSLTVEENLSLGAIRFWPRSARKRIAETLPSIFELFPKLADRRDQMAGTLSGGEQQMVAIGRSLMSKPDLLLLDEPSLGLAPIVVQEIYAALRVLREEGLTILLVEQNSDLASRFCDRMYVLRLGEIVAEGAKGELTPEQLHRAYFGAEPGAEAAQVEAAQVEAAQVEGAQVEGGGTGDDRS
jgi:branched-chain amino acid transport system ATP-binding protein